MNPGQYKHRITFQQFIESETENGFPVEGGEDVITVYAAIRTLKGNEFYEAATTQNENNSRFIIRYRKGISPDMQIQMRDGRTFEIISLINDNEENKTLTIHAREVK
ncbi:phage head closure protein [Cytobacillus firmus]|uniref:Putative phage head-tail adaptor n=1 Tax=Cytobacillus firmus TaxID=1399 RepID=A0A800MU56_CYTFI|nr:phage head closure protein [Cytobacillus firmus]KAF0822514.1 putative phage head-tail adaptor [Cytobacillus firmus]